MYLFSGFKKMCVIVYIIMPRAKTKAKTKTKRKTKRKTAKRKPRKAVKHVQDGEGIYDWFANKLTGSKLLKGEIHAPVYTKQGFKAGNYIGQSGPKS